MRTVARFLVYVMFMASAVMLMVQPFWIWSVTGELNPFELLAYCVAAFALIFTGTEASERMRDMGRGGGKDVED